LQSVSLNSILFSFLLLAEKVINRKARSRKLNNIEFKLTDCKTELQNESLDRIVCYDVLHFLKPPDANVKEFHRILKPDGIFSLSDHHMKETDILEIVTKDNLFKLSSKSGIIYNFSKI
jgi:SAM-dependent methyltransferase